MSPTVVDAPAAARARARAAATAPGSLPDAAHLSPLLLRFRGAAVERAFAEHWAAVRRPADETNMLRGLLLFAVLWAVRVRRGLGMPDALAANVLLRVAFLAHRALARRGVGAAARSAQALTLHAVRWVSFPWMFAAEPRRCYHHVSGHIALVGDAVLGIAGTQLMLPLPWAAAVPAQAASAAVVAAALGLGPGRWCDTCGWLAAHAAAEPSAGSLLRTLDASACGVSGAAALGLLSLQLFVLPPPEARCAALLAWVTLCLGLLLPLAASYALEARARLAFAADLDTGRGGALTRAALGALPLACALTCAGAWPLCCGGGDELGLGLLAAA